jgi:hypothetical protein
MASLTRESRLVDRSKWLEDCFRRTEPSELVFFDPDNGIEVRSVPKHNIKAGKYIYWNELVGFWDRGQALLIYHHLNRTKPAAEQVTELGAHLRAKFDGALIKPLVFRRGSCRVFWLVCPLTSIGREIERRGNAFLSNGWTAHFGASAPSIASSPAAQTLSDIEAMQKLSLTGKVMWTPRPTTARPTPINWRSTFMSCGRNAARSST